MCKIALLVCLVLGAHAVDTSKERPVTKVINMLKDMSAQLEAEAEADEEAYEKMGCYCTTNDKEKTAAIAAGEQRIAELGSRIEAMAGKSANLRAEVGSLNGEIAENEAGLDKATDIRTKERADFNADEKNMITSIGGLKGAVTTLGKHNSLSQESFMAVANSLKHKLNEKDLKKFLDLKPRKLVASFLQGLKQPAGYQSYAPQSGQIFGVLKQMKESFEKNLAEAQSEESSAETEFANMRAAKTAELAAARTSVQNKETEIADADMKGAQAKEDKEAAEAQLAADTEFLANLKAQCATLDREYAERTKTRSLEISAVSDTIGILNDDDAHDQFSKTLGFIQVSMRTRRVRASDLASKKLMDAAKRAKDPRLSALAVSMKIDAFSFVKDKVEAMIADLEAEAASEIKKRDECNADLHNNDQEQNMKYKEKADLESTIGDLQNTLAGVDDEIKTLNDEIAAQKVDMQRTSEDREIENKAFQETLQDQRACQQILARAVDRLKQFYGGALVQVQKQDPGSFATYEKKGGGGVIAMIQGVIDDSVNLEREALQDEQDSQSAYEQFIVDGNKAIAARQTSVNEKQAVRAETDGDLTTAKGDLEATMGDLSDLNNLAKNLHNSCDFLLGNFDTRIKARDMEVEALRASVAMLSGAAGGGRF